MKKIASFLIVLSMVINATACNNSNPEKKENSDKVRSEKIIKVYYFHSAHRCKTCVAVEKETKNALKELYPQEMKSGVISFYSINMDEKEGEKLAKEMKISGQTLIFVQGEKTINLTNEGFMYAVTNPQKLKSKIKTTTDKLRK